MRIELDKAYDALNVAPPTYEPAASGHVPEMIEIIMTLIGRGHAYAAEDGSGDVYFDVRSWPAYGELTGQRLDDMAPAEDADPRGKRDPRDFALWKGWKQETEPESAAWPSPWGRGRPGWHVACSAMALKYLGAAFDIHGAASICAFRTTRSSRPSPGRPGTGSRRTGCTTPGSPPPARR
jgi:cysteinyl-tRNA synthetase